MPRGAATRTARKPSGSTAAGPPVAAAILLAAAGAFVAWPALGVARDAAAALPNLAPRDLAAALSVPPAVLLRSALAALGVALLATALGWPAARLLASGARWAPLLAAPMLLPMHLAYAGWSQARAPLTPIGDWLESLAAHGHRWAPLLADRVLAFTALALWAAPIAAILIAIDMARTDRSLHDAARLDRANPVARARLSISLHRAALAWSVGLVTLLMLGSAVPFHLAQFDTLAIVAWRRLGETDPRHWWSVWAGAWPAVLTAVIAGWIIAGRITRSATPTGQANEPAHAGPRPAGLACSILAACVWAAGTLGPLALYWANAGGLRSLRTFIDLEGHAAAASARTGALVALAAAALAACTCLLLSGGQAWARRVVSLAARAFLIAALVPGILVGAAFAGSGWGGHAALVGAHLARYGFLALAVGCWLASAEPPDRRALRRLESRAGLRAWAATCLPWQWGPILGAALAALALSLHEIEASIMIQPPGVPSLAQSMLGMLHYARTRELAAASVVLVGSALLVALAATALLAPGFRLPRPSGGSPPA